jgi:uncharacterized damage-inducible protein DinB
MGTRHFELLAKYNSEANKLMNAHIKTLTQEQWDKQFAGFFKSIHEVCSHIYVSDFAWLKRYKALKNFTALDTPLFDQNYRFDETYFSSISEYLDKRAALDEIIVKFISEITPNDLEVIFKYTNMHGIQLEKRVEGLLIHLLNHQTHHRGVVSAYLEMLGIANDFSAVVPYV